MSASEDFLTHVIARLDRLDQQAMQVRLSAIKMSCYLSLGPSEPRRSKAIIACIDAGLLWSPIAEFGDGIERAIQGVLDQHEEDACS
jgi:hypothetical protein